MNTASNRPLTYMITAGDADESNFAEKRPELLGLIRAAADAGVSLIQIREKRLDIRSLFALVQQAVDIVRTTRTKLLVNDRVDVSVAAGADGVHLTTRSMSAGLIRAAYGPELVIAVSTHNTKEALTAAADGADLIVFGPVFASPDKGEPAGVEMLRHVCSNVDIPVIALGGIDVENFGYALSAGAAGIAGIRCFSDPAKMSMAMRAFTTI